jgi:O-antigen ligase
MSQSTVIVMAESPTQVRTRSHTTLSIVLLFALLTFAVLAFGAVEPWAIYALESAAAVLAGFELWRGLGSRLRYHALYPALAGMAFVVLLQLVFATTVYSWITASQLKGLIALEMLFFVAVQLLYESDRVRLFLYLLSFAGFAIAAFALVQKFTGNGRIYWVKELQYNFAYFGPYANKNHYAGLMEMLFPLPLFLALTVRDIEKRALLGFLSIMMAASIFLSSSRGGMLACMVQILLIVGLLAISNGGEGSKASTWVSAAALIVSLGFLIWWLNDRQAVDRLLTLRDPLTDDTSGNRLTILRDSLPIIRHHPWFGTGLGTFPTIYPSYRSFYSESLVNAGHNDYLQLIVETGLFGALAFGWFAWIFVRNFARLLREWRLDRLATLQMAATVSCFGLLIHSVVDFNLHIPANAALFFVLLAIATNAPRRKDTDAGSGKIRSM